MQTIRIVFSLISLAVAARAFQTSPPIPPAEVASGKSLIISTQETGIAGNRRVDIGSLQIQGDRLNVPVLQDLVDQALQLMRGDHPQINIPPASLLTTRELIHCDTEGLIAATAEITIQSPHGSVLYHRTFDAERDRQRQEASKLHAEAPFNYGRTPASLACWAIARKSEGKEITWPPPDPPKTGSKDTLHEYASMFMPKR